MNANERELLKSELALLDDAAAILRLSYEKCRIIEFKADMSNDDQESFEAFCSRFSRASDIFIQKMLRLIDILDLEQPGTVRDRINRAEKKGIVDNAGDLIDIRKLRNDISHEYLPEAVRDIWKSVLDYTPKLLSSIDNFKVYSARYIDNKQT